METCPSDEAERPGLGSDSREAWSSVWLLQLQCRCLAAGVPLIPRLARVWGLKGMGTGELTLTLELVLLTRARQLDELPRELQRVRTT